MREIKFRSFYNNRTMLYSSSYINLYYFFELKPQRFPFMQFTGLTDKNGKEIYEGDVIKNDGLDCIVEYKAPEFLRRVIKHDLRNQTYPFKSHHEYEVIGNIHENPELLTESLTS